MIDIDSTPTTTSTVRRRAPRVAVAFVALLALGACTSLPGPKRVAEDIIRAEKLANPKLDEKCLLDQLDKYSKDDMEKLGDLLISDNADQKAEGETQLAAFEALLKQCVPGSD